MDTLVYTCARHRRGVLLVSMAASLWGTAALAAKQLYLTTDISIFALCLFRLALALPLLALVSWRTLGKEFFLNNNREAAAMVLVGILFAFYLAAYYAAIASGGVALASLTTLCAAPLMVALLSWLFLGQRLTRQLAGALMAAIAGMICLVGAPGVSSLGVNPLLGAALGLASALGYALVTMISRSLLPGMHPLKTTTISLTVALVVLLPAAWKTGITLNYQPTTWLLLLYMGLIPTSLGYLMFFSGLRHIPSTAATLLTMAEPLTASIGAYYIFGESLGPLGWGGAVLLIGSILFLYKEPYVEEVSQ